MICAFGFTSDIGGYPSAGHRFKFSHVKLKEDPGTTAFHLPNLIPATLLWPNSRVSANTSVLVLLLKML